MSNLELEELFPSAKSLQDELSPRDILFLKNLTRFGLRIIEIRISPISQALNQKVGDIDLPDGALIINIIKDGESFFPANDMIIEEGDTIYILAYQFLEQALRDVFIPFR